MKTILQKTLLSFALLLLVNIGFAQELKKDFELKSSQNELKVSSGNSAQISFEILRSKKYMSNNIELSADLPDGISVEFSPSSTTETQAKATFKVGANLSPGSYPVVIKGESNNVKKGTMIMLVVE